MADQPSLTTFARAFWTDWGERMSGPLSVPLMLSALFIPNLYIAVGTGLLGIFCGIYASYRVWSTERTRVIELEKISRTDLQRMLGGAFLGNTFIYGGELNLCKRYKGKFELDQLCADFDRIDVRAPGGSISNMKFQLNAHREWSGRYYVMIRDGAGHVEKVDNIYDPMPILLGTCGEFFAKLVRDQGVEFEDNNELWVIVEDWKK